MILAGNASTALTMSSILLMLAMHPEIQNQVYEEIILCINDDDDDITPENISKLETLDLVIKETMRLFPVAPIIGREISEDLQLDEGIILPKGVDIGIRIFDIHRNPAIWGLDSNQFKPERFKDLSKIHPYSFLPFSLGQRNCIGFKYATNTIRIVLSHILRKFEISTPLKYDELQLEISFVLRISQSYIIQIKRR
jgi:cytochrome P450